MRTEPTTSAQSYLRLWLTHPGLTAVLMVVGTGIAILLREAVAAALLSGLVVGLALSGSV